MGIYGQSPGITTNRRCVTHKKYPYLLRALGINRPCMVWCSDIAYLPINQGHVYLVAIMDWHSKYVLRRNFQIPWTANSALGLSGKLWQLSSLIFTDQGCQFTREAFTGELENANVKISMVWKRKMYG